MTHPQSDPGKGIDPLVKVAVEFEALIDDATIENFRLPMFDEWIAKACKLEEEQKRWAACSPTETRQLASAIHVPFIRWVIEKYDCRAHELADHMWGCPMSADLPFCPHDVAAEQPKYRGDNCTIDELRPNRVELNVFVRSKAKTMEHEDDTALEVEKDIEISAMTPPLPFFD